MGRKKADGTAEKENVETAPRTSTEGARAPRVGRQAVGVRGAAAVCTGLTLVWNVQNMCVRNGCSQARERTLFSTIVHSTSSSIKTTSFFRAFIAKN